MSRGRAGVGWGLLKTLITIGGKMIDPQSEGGGSRTQAGKAEGEQRDGSKWGSSSKVAGGRARLGGWEGGAELELAGAGPRA